jgi:hydroxymethylglutaryl-CoA synthase
MAIEVAKALHLNQRIFTADVQFSTKSGTSAIQIGYALVRSGRARQVLTLGSDTINRMTAPGTVAEYAASSAAGAAIIGTEGVIAEIEATLSYATDLSDEFRVAGEQHIRSGGFQALASSLESDFGIKAHIVEAVHRFFDQQHLSPDDFSYAIFQQPYGVVPFSLGEALNFDLSKITPGCTAYELGNCGSASVLIGLGNILDIVKPDDRILVASYGAGAGCDVLGLRITDEIEKHKGRGVSVEDLIADKQMLDYVTAMIYEDKFGGGRR